MIAPGPGLIDWMISSLSHLVALPTAQLSTHSNSSPLPVTPSLPPITSSTPNPFNSVTLYAPIPLSKPFSILSDRSLRVLMCLILCLSQRLPPNVQDSHFLKWSWLYNCSQEHHQDSLCLVTSWFEGVFCKFEVVVFQIIMKIIQSTIKCHIFMYNIKMFYKLWRLESS